MALTDLTRISTSGIATGSSLSGAILHGDAHFRGTQVGVTSALFDSSDNALEFNDNVKATFGTSNEKLEIYHNGNHGHITLNNAGYLHLQGNYGVLIQRHDGSENMIKALSNGAVELYYDESTYSTPKLKTTATGVVVDGILTATSFSGPIVGNTNNSSGLSTFYDLRVSNNLTVEGTTTTLDTNLVGVDRIEVGADSNTVVGVAITQSGTADILNLFNGSGEQVTVLSSGNVGIGSAIPELDLDVARVASGDNVVKLENRASALSLIKYPNVNNADVRAGSDYGNFAVYTGGDSGSRKLKVEHGGNVLIENGNVGINSNPGAALEVNGGTSYDVAIFNSYHADGPLIPIQRSGTNIGFLGSGKNLAPSTGGADDLALRSQANLIFTSGGGTERLRITSAGNILPGTNNATNIGDGTTNFNSIWASTRFRGNDNVKLVLGNSQNLVIRHDGSNNIIGSPVADDLHIKSGTGDNDNQLIMAFKHGGNVGIGTDTPIGDFTVLTDGNGYFGIDGSGGYGAEFNVYHRNTKVNTYKFSNNGGANELAQHYLTSAAGKYLWYIGGTAASNEKMRLTTTGLGIGTDSPSSLLEVASNSPKISLTDTDNNSEVYLHNVGGAAILNAANSDIVFQTPTKELVRFQSTGRVGIGTYNPIGKLHVADTNTTVWPFTSAVSDTYSYTPYPHELVIDNDVRGTEGSFAGIYFNAGSDTDGGKVSTARIAAIDAGSYKADLVFSNRGSGGSDHKENLRITSTGDVLIGGHTQGGSDTSKLSVYDSSSNIGIIQVHCATENDGDLAGITFGQGGSGTTGRPKFAIAAISAASYGRGNLCFYVDGTADNNPVSTADEKVRITSDGRMGVGNNNPQFMIHTEGSGNNGGVRFENSHTTTTVSGNTASGAFPHNLLLSNYSGSGSADDRMVSIGFDIPTTSSHANAVIAYQATASNGTGDLQFWLENGNTSYERLRIKADGEVHISDRNSASAGVHFFQAGSYGIRMNDINGYNHWYIERNYGGFQSTPQVTLKASGHTGFNILNPTSVIHGQDDSAAETVILKLRNYKSSTNTKPTLRFEASSSGGQGANADIQGLAGTDAGGAANANDSGMKFIVRHGGSGTEREAYSIKKDGNIHFPDGQGINFGATAGGNASSGIFHDYEEGLWTPTVTQGIDGGYSFSIVRGWYIKVGGLVQISFFVRFVNNATGSTGNGNHFKMGGLPYAAVDLTAAYSSGGHVTYTNCYFNNSNTIVFSIYDATTQMEFHSARASTATLSGSNANRDIYGVGTYRSA